MEKSLRSRKLIQEYHDMWISNGILPKDGAEIFGLSQRYVYELLKIVAKNHGISREEYLDVPHKKHCPRGQNCNKIENNKADSVILEKEFVEVLELIDSVDCLINKNS